MKFIFKCPKVYFFHLKFPVSEGGMSRNYAFYLYFKRNNFFCFNLYHRFFLVRAFKNILGLLILILVRKKYIFFHLGSMLLLFPRILFRFKFIKIFIELLLDFTSKNNKLIIEINDLSYEQAIDLELNIDFKDKIIQHFIFSLKRVEYVFSSTCMLEFARDNYSLNSNNSRIVINGGPELLAQKDFNQIMSSQKIRFVYAGSLNKGRQIESLINLFQSLHSNFELYLLGNGGKWINELVLKNNIFYIGPLSENDAHEFVSSCDMGLIPYDSNRLYYNICFPTKVSFYITAGIPFLSTPLVELKNRFKNKKYANFMPIEEWESEIVRMNAIDLELQKDVIRKEMKNYIWTNVIDEGLNNLLD